VEGSSAVIEGRGENIQPTKIPKQLPPIDALHISLGKMVISDLRQMIGISYQQQK